MTLKLIGLIVPLGLDSFAIAAALGMAGLSPRERRRIPFVFAAFEMAMPVVGLLIGAALGSTIGGVADYVAIATLLGLALYMLLGAEEAEADQAAQLARTHGWAIIGLGVSISLDELAIGFALGLLRLPILLAIVLIGAQAFIFAQLGVRLGERVGEQLRETAERLAGIGLAAVAVALLIEQLA